MIMIPGKTILNITMAYLINNFWMSYLILTTSSIVGSSLAFLLGQKLLRNWILAKSRENIFFCVLLNEMHYYQWKTIFLVRIISVPPAIKNYLLSISGCHFYQFLIGSIPFWLFYGGLFTMIGYEINNLDDLSKIRHFDSLTKSQKIYLILSYC